MPTTDPDDWFEGDGWHDTWQPYQPGGAEGVPSAIGAAPIQKIGNTVTQSSGPENAVSAVSHQTPGPSAPTGTGQRTFHADYAELEKFAVEHDLIAQDVMKWATGDPDFAERYLATHGKVNYGTYLKIKEFLASKLAAGAAFAERNTQTSTALRGVLTDTSAVDEANATALNIRTV